MTKLSRESAGRVLIAYLAMHVAELRLQGTRLRADEPGAVHEMRIAARRVRSALATYRPLFDAHSIDHIGEDLQWLGRSLGDARDAQVLRERLGELVAAESPELVLGPVANRVDDELRAAERAGMEQALLALDSERYVRLLAALDELVTAAPVVPEAASPATEVLPGLLRRDAKRLRRSVKAIDRSRTREQRDVALHEARKKAKRMRYAAESAVPALGRPAKSLAGSAKKLQQALGEHQDAVVSRRRLREYAVRAHGRGENGFTVGRLHALEQRHADDAEQKFSTAWKARPGKNVRRWTHT
ncbi:MAG: CHAD domain-containing protein [Aeromicrobium sp.]